jgi:acyl dehydratase
MPSVFFEDFVPGSVTTFQGPTVTKDEIIAFAREFDPQPFHLDEAAAKQTFAGGLIASGWHTCAMTMRMNADGYLLDAAGMGAPGIEEVKWIKPVLPGDTLSVRRTVLETRESRSRPEMGLVHVSTDVLNQAGEVVMTQLNWIMFGRRGATPASAPVPDGRDARSGSPAHLEAAFVPAAADPPRQMPFLDDIVPGETRNLGAYTFTPEAIIAFAQRFDPQPFHLDPEAAARSHFGGLVASGWHTAVIWMRLLVRDLTRAAKTSLARGERPARVGSSPGFRDLKWLKPVYAGDTISYRTTATDKRVTGSQPGWGLLFHENSGVNQKGEEVLRFSGSVFWERRAA